MVVGSARVEKTWWWWLDGRTELCAANLGLRVQSPSRVERQRVDVWVRETDWEWELWEKWEVNGAGPSPVCPPDKVLQLFWPDKRPLDMELVGVGGNLWLLIVSFFLHINEVLELFGNGKESIAFYKATREEGWAFCIHHLRSCRINTGTRYLPFLATTCSPFLLFFLFSSSVLVFQCYSLYAEITLHVFCPFLFLALLFVVVVVTLWMKCSVIYSSKIHYASDFCSFTDDGTCLRFLCYHSVGCFMIVFFFVLKCVWCVWCTN